MITYKIHSKDLVFWIKKSFIKAIIALIFVIAGIIIFIPHGTQADFLIDNASFLNNVSTAQENTILPNSKTISAPDVVRRIKMVITAYSSTVGQTDSTPFITASGDLVQDGIVANNLLPFGTKVRVPAVYGDKIFVVQDRMNSRKGNYHLDIWFDNQSEAKEFGSEIAYIEVLSD